MGSTNIEVRIAIWRSVFDDNPDMPMNTARQTVFAALVCLAVIARAETPKSEPTAVEIDGGAYHFTVDTSEAPDLAEWAQAELIPVLQKW